MRFFKRSEETETKTESQEEELLTAELFDEAITFEVAMKIPTFSACINLICDTVSTIPIKLYRKNGDVIEEVKDDERVSLLNRDTKDTLDGMQFKRAIIKDYFGKGGYAYINRKGTGIESIHYVDNRELAFQYSTDPIFKAYTIQVQGKEYESYHFIKLLRNTKNGYSATDITQENKEILSVAYNSLMFEKNLVKTGGNKKGFIQAPRKVTDEVIKNVKKAWRKLYSNNTENMVFLNDGLQFKESSNTSVEMQLNENKKVNADEICKIFNMPPEMIKGGAKQEDKVNFIQYCIVPVLDALECALNRDLLLETEKNTYFWAADISELTKGDMKTRYEAYSTAINAGFIQVDEVRFKENMAALGLEYVKLGLQDVLYNPKTKEFFIPNMNQKGGFEKETTKGGEMNNED